METAADVEIEQGCLRRLLLNDSHTWLGKHKTLSTVTTGPATVYLSFLFIN